jgi:hypothetical protein
MRRSSKVSFQSCNKGNAVGKTGSWIEAKKKSEVEFKDDRKLKRHMSYYWANKGTLLQLLIQSMWTPNKCTAPFVGLCSLLAVPAGFLQARVLGMTFAAQMGFGCLYLNFFLKMCSNLTTFAADTQGQTAGETVQQNGTLRILRMLDDSDSKRELKASFQRLFYCAIFEIPGFTGLGSGWKRLIGIAMHLVPLYLAALFALYSLVFARLSSAQHVTFWVALLLEVPSFVVATVSFLFICLNEHLVHLIEKCALLPNARGIAVARMNEEEAGQQEDVVEQRAPHVEVTAMHDGGVQAMALMEGGENSKAISIDFPSAYRNYVILQWVVAEYSHSWTLYFFLAEFGLLICCVVMWIGMLDEATQLITLPSNSNSLQGSIVNISSTVLSATVAEGEWYASVSSVGVDHHHLVWEQALRSVMATTWAVIAALTSMSVWGSASDVTDTLQHVREDTYGLLAQLSIVSTPPLMRTKLQLFYDYINNDRHFPAFQSMEIVITRKLGAELGYVCASLLVGTVLFLARAWNAPL